MLSPGEWYKLVPTELVANVEFRIALLKKCAQDSEFRAGIELICSQDIVFWIDVFGWQFNPMMIGEDAHKARAPFICWDCQVDMLLDRPETTGKPGILWCYEKRRTAVVQKSREMGASWLFLFFQAWLALYHPDSQSLNISRNEMMVDSASPNSLFWKLREINKTLPDWMKGEVVQQSMHFEYKKTGSYITGEASTGAAGVGGRAGVVFVDEFPRIKEDVAVRQGTASTSDARFFNGTHQGTNTEFFKLTITPEIIQLVLHWSQHPVKRRGAYRWNAALNKPDLLDPDYDYPPDYNFDKTGKPVGGPFPGLRSIWYDWKCTDIGSDAGVAQELDINPAGSVGQAFDDVLINNLVLSTARPPIWTGNLAKDEKNPKEYRMVENREGGPLSFWTLPDLKGHLPIAVYKIGCDLSQGTGRTNSCITIFNADTGVRIGEFITPSIYPEVLAPMVVWLAKRLVDEDGRPAEIIWEMQGPGDRFGKEIILLGFTNIFWNDNSLGIEFNHSKKKNPGWNAETKAKNLVLKEYETALRDRLFLNYSELALKECQLFIWSNDGKKIHHSGSLNQEDPSGAGDNHGDRTMADALAWKIAKDYATSKKKARAEQEAPVYSYEWRKQHRAARKPGRSGIYD